MTSQTVNVLKKRLKWMHEVIDTSYSLLRYSSTVSWTLSLTGGTMSRPTTISSAALWNLQNKS